MANPRKASKKSSRSKKQGPRSRSTSGPERATPAPRSDHHEPDEAMFTAHVRLGVGADRTAATEHLSQAGLKPIFEAHTGTIVVAATDAQVRDQLDLRPKRKDDVAFQTQRVPRALNRAMRIMKRRSYTGCEKKDPPPAAKMGNQFVFPVPFDYWQPPSAHAPRASYYHLHPARDLARIFGVEGLHARGVLAEGIRIVMIDSGFYRHPYYMDPGIHNGVIPQVTRHSVLPAPLSDLEVDDIGHGTGIAANVFALAPACDFHHVKDDDDPLAGMIRARTLQPHIITCSWGYPEDVVKDHFDNYPNNGTTMYWRDLEAEIRAAVDDDVVVLFASGNGPGPGSWPSSVPGVISVGGALVDEDLTLMASSYAKSFVSEIYPPRSCPDVCGLVGPAPHGLLLAMPTQPDNEFDAMFSAVDGTEKGDGWLIGSGTSSATPQVAGVVALLLELHGGLTPGQVLVRLRDMAVGVHRGTTATGHIATSDRPNVATGHGLVTFRRPNLENGYAGVY